MLNARSFAALNILESSFMGNAGEMIDPRPSYDKHGIGKGCTDGEPV